LAATGHAVTIEVDVTNARAANLYLETGFREDRIYDYLAVATG
jgi:ribosomal protein S18 acetylase RimI-like enzyme